MAAVTVYLRLMSDTLLITALSSVFTLESGFNYPKINAKVELSL